MVVATSDGREIVGSSPIAVACCGVAQSVAHSVKPRPVFLRSHNTLCWINIRFPGHTTTKGV